MSVKSYPARVVDTLTPGEIVDPSSPIFPSGNITAHHIITSGAWFSANDPLALPFFLDRRRTVFQLGWVNGSGTMTDNIDVGIYDTGWTRLVSTGSTARTGVSAAQWVDIADTALTAGKYYLCAACNGTTANQQTNMSGTSISTWLTLAGCLDSATDAFPLPNPLTNMAASATAVRIPLLMMAFRATP